MGLIILSHNDDVRAIADKCNLNFRELSKSMAQALEREGRSIDTDVSQMIAAAMSGLVDTVIPNEVALQISNANIPRLVMDEVASQIETEDTSNVSDFLTPTQNVVVTNGVAHKWGRLATITFAYKLANAYTVPPDGKISGLNIGTLKQGWRKASGLTNVTLDAAYQIVGVIDNSGVIAPLSANATGTSYTIDTNATLYAGFTYMLA